MDPAFTERMTKIANDKADSSKSVVLSERTLRAIVKVHLQQHEDKIDPHFKFWVKSRRFQFADLPGLGLHQVLAVPNGRKDAVSFVMALYLCSQE